jgi:hypothetical protein
MLHGQFSRAATIPGRRLISCWIALGFLALQLGWLMATPPFRGIDEIDHVYRASSVASGHWRAPDDRVDARLGGGDYVWVRADLVEAAAPACAILDADRPARCRPLERRASEVEVASSAARYNPLFYAFVGSIARPFHGDAALVAMRLAGAIACTVLLGLTAWVTLLWARTAWPLLAMLIAVTPTTVYSSTVAAPNGLEMVSGLFLWAALVARLHDGVPHRRAVSWCVAAAIVLVANLHTLGLLWAPLILLTALLAAGRWRVLDRRDRPLVPPIAFAVVGYLAAAAWVVASRANDPRLDPDYDFPLRASPFARSIVIWPLQAFGAFPDRFDLAPAVVYLLLVPTAVALLGIALKGGWRRDRRLMGCVAMTAGLSAAIPVLATIATHRQVGIAWQGRYGMPYGVGMVILASVLIDRSGRPVHRRHVAWVVTVTTVASFASLHGFVALMRASASDSSYGAGWGAPSAIVLTGLCAAAAVLFGAALNGATNLARARVRVSPHQEPSHAVS